LNFKWIVDSHFSILHPGTAMTPKQNPSNDIRHISDIALWVAFYRAMESKRPDAHFRDPYAEILAGERGKQIVEKMKRGRQSAWSMIVRTVVFWRIHLPNHPGKWSGRRPQLGCQSL